MYNFLPAANANAAPDPRFSYFQIETASSPAEERLTRQRRDYSWRHARPYSVFIAAMGYHWSPQSWQRVIDMLRHTIGQGFYVCMEEIMDRCLNPYDALGAMRNEALMRASQGFEFILYIDNDILPEPDTLLRLLKWDLPIIAPFVQEPDGGRVLHGPVRAPMTGVQKARWCVLSMLLCRTAVFSPWIGGEFWNDSIGADEGYHFQKLWAVGHRPYIDTDVILPVAKKPTYPLAVNRLEKLDADEFWETRRQWLNAVPDRAPIDPYDPNTQHGMYLPFPPPPEDHPLSPLQGVPYPLWAAGGGNMLLARSG